MAEIHYIEGDATTPVGSGPRIIAHVCNDVGGWGRGFVLALNRRWREPENDFRAWFARRAEPDCTPAFALGEVRVVTVETQLWVANIVGQHGLKPQEGVPPVRYAAIERALRTVGDAALERGASVHMPRIGCGLAGGRWEEIEPLIQGELRGRGVDVWVYDLPQ